MFAIAFWNSDSTFTVMNLESIKSPRREIHDYKVGDEVEALYKQKLLTCRLYEIGVDRAVLMRRLNKGFKLDLEVLLEKKNVQSSERPKDGESVKESIQSGTALPKKNKPKTPATEKTVTKTKRKASKRGKENKGKKQKKDENYDSFSDEYPEEHDLSYSILKMRRENKTTPAHLNSAQQEYPTASVPLHQIPLQQTIPCNQQQLQSQSPPPIHQQSTPVNQQQQPSLQQQQYGAQQLSTESLIKQQQSSIQQWPYHPQQSQTQEQHSQIQQQSSTQQWPTQQQENLTQQMSSTQQWPAQQQSSTQQWPVQQHSSTQPWQAQTQLTPTLKKQPQAQNKQNPAQQQQLADTQQSILNQQQHPELATQQSRIEDTSISGLFRDAMDTVNDYSYDDLEFTDMSSSTPTHIPRGNIHQRSSAETPQRVSNCHSCCKKVEFLTKELVELRRQVQQLLGRKLSDSRCSSSSVISDESESTMNLTQPCLSKPVRSTDDQHDTIENKEKMKDIIKKAIGNEKRVANATRKAMTSVFSLSQLTTCSMKGLHTNKATSSPRPGLPVSTRNTVQEVLAEMFEISEESAFIKMRTALRGFESQWSGLDIPNRL